MRVLWVASAVSALLIFPSAPSVEWLSPIVPVAVPAADNSAEPQVSARGDRALLSWIEQAEEHTTLKFAERTATGWSEPRSVAAGDDWLVNFADMPSVIGLADGSLAAHWLQQNEGDESYDVRLAFSTDDGRTWSAPTSPHHDGTPREHGFVSLFQAPGDAGLGVVWLDHRTGKDMDLRAAVFDRKGAQTSESVIKARVCECCPTATGITADGPIVAFRNRSAVEIRDIHVSRLVNGRWTAPAPVHRDNWKIDACPVNGPALSANGRTVAVAWFTAAGDAGHVFLAFSTDSGRTFGAPVRVDDVGAVGRVGVELLPNDSAAVTWIELAGGRSEFKVRRVERTGARSDAVSVAGTAVGRTSGYPRLARHGDELLFAWTEATDGSHEATERSHVRTAAARVR
jgi:hypothetical protein